MRRAETSEDNSKSSTGKPTKVVTKKKWPSDQKKYAYTFRCT